MPTDATKARVLVIEDDVDIQQLIRSTLARQGFEVEQELDGRAGLEAAVERPPDLILLDIMLPEMDGRDVLAELKKREQTRDVPVIVISARGAQSDRRVALELGADDYIDKPFSPRLLISRVEYRLWKTEESGG
jgi:DNA-binding response OmpR family regulator